MVAFKGHFDGRVIIPDEPLDLEPGQRLVVQLLTQEIDGPAATGQVQPGESLKSMLEDAIDDPSLPADGSFQHDHYLYGTPKKSPLKP
jgi:hypothetical protein